MWIFVLVCVCGLIVLAMFEVSGRREMHDRKRKAVQLADELREKGFHRIPCALDCYAVGDIRGMVDEIASVEEDLRGVEETLRDCRRWTGPLARKD